MKYFLLSGLVLVSGLCFPFSSYASDTPVLVDSHFNTAYIPDGFDSNDNAQIVGEGLFNNSCYKPANVEVNVDQQAKQIQVRSKAYFYDGICLQVLVPYHQVIDLGILDAGHYKVVDMDRKLELGELNIRLATSSDADDFLYAPVTQAYVEHFDSGKNFITLTGMFSNSCMRLVDVKVDVQNRVIVVQPISEMIQGQMCMDGAFPYEKKFEIPATVQHNTRYLLHVRILNGKAVNNIVDIQ